MLEDILRLSMDDCDASMEERAMPRLEAPLAIAEFDLAPGCTARP